jgi:anionic cell wall polymer biosynthesis LytR-Cps2A-Psr (LCP) family protein
MNTRKSPTYAVKYVLKIIALSLLTIIIALTLVSFAILSYVKSGEKRLSSQSKPELPKFETSDEINPHNSTKPIHSTDYYSADVIYNGKAYNYRTDLINILFIGVDKKSEKNIVNQADALYLVVYDKRSNEANILAISRNTYAPVKMYDKITGIYTEGYLQICLAYGYGNDDSTGSELTVSSVSKLLYGVPINGYFTYFISEMPYLIDKIGGVTLKIETDMTKISPRLNEGATVTLTGNEAVKYLVWRDETNNTRVNNHITFIKSFISQTKSKLLDNPLYLIDLYNSTKNVAVTNIPNDSAAYLLSLAPGIKLGGFFKIEGQSDVLNGTEVMYPDDDKLIETILKLFYTEVN